MSGISKIDVLTRDNYDTWRIQMEALLIKCELLGYVNGDIVKPEDEAAAAIWVKNDLKAKAEIVLAIGPSAVKQIKGCSTSREVWLKLESIYQPKAPAKKAALLTKSKIKCFRCSKYGRKAFRRSADRHKRREEDMMGTCHGFDSAFLIPNAWCLDSGATSHVGKDPQYFTRLYKRECGTLNLATHDSCNVNSGGSVRFTTVVNGNVRHINLDNALHVPELRTNLLSVSRITDKGYRVVFDKNGAKVVAKSGRVSLVANRQNNLYIVKTLKPADDSFLNARNNNISLRVWHSRLGHLNLRDLRKVLQERDIKFRDSADGISCKVCADEKMMSSEEISSSSSDKVHKKVQRKKEILDVVHMAVCGPMRENSLAGSKYLIIFMDASSRWCEVRFMGSKLEIFDKARDVLKLMEIQTGRRVKCLKSDKECINKNFELYLKKNGIRRRRLTTPDQSGIAERKMLSETAKCLLLESGLPQKFWAEAVYTANYLRNRCPSSSINGSTPYELWTKRKPTISHLRTFGCTVSITDGAPCEEESEPSSKKGTFVGYPEDSKGYRVWIEGEGIRVYRSVKFLNEIEEKTESCEQQKTNSVEFWSAIPGSEEKDGEDKIPDESRVQEPDTVVRAHTRRTRKIRSGRSGRPKKIRKEGVEVNCVEFGLINEVPIVKASADEEAPQWYNDRKARMVAQGFRQKPGVHFNETFASLRTRRTSVALSARYGRYTEQST